MVEPVEVDGISVQVSGSLGIAIYPDHSTDTDELCRFADGAMYKAKQSDSQYFYYELSSSE